MAPDPNGPARKSVFKINTGKLPYSQNTPEACVYCEAKRAPGAPPLPLCNGCRSVRYCGKEHQKVHWPTHKAFCKVQRMSHEAARAETTTHACGLPPAQERKYLVEDWIELHRKNIEEALAWALNDRSTPYDFNKQYVCFTVKYRLESEGNPSLAFTLVSAKFADLPPAGTPAALSFSVFLPKVQKCHDEEKGNKGFMAVVPCLYFIDNEVTWLTTSFIYKSSIPHFRFPDRPFYYMIQYCAHYGVVFRLEGDGDNNWMPGLMSKHPSGTKWVWKKHTLAELAAKGISLSAARPDSDTT